MLALILVSQYPEYAYVPFLVHSPIYYSAGLRIRSIFGRIRVLEI